MNRGSLILINTAKDLLKQDGCELFGRFMIALISQATQERAAIDEKDRLPTLVFIDEAADYFDDQGVGLEELLNQARKQKVGLTLAHQNLGQLPRKLQATIMASTSSKLVGGLSAADLDVFAKKFGIPAEEMREVMQKTEQQATFVAYVRNQIPPQVRFHHTAKTFNQAFGILSAIDRAVHQSLDGFVLQLPAKHVAIHLPSPFSLRILTPRFLLFPVKEG